MSKEFKLTINADQIAKDIGEEVNKVAQTLEQEVRGLAIQTHAKVIEFANEDLKGWQLQHFLGDGGKNIRWAQVSDNIWVVEIDESVGWLNDGRPPTSMATEEWLLKNAKVAKDGSKYKVIPFTHGKQSHGTNAMLSTVAKNIIKQARDESGKRINLRKIERNPDGTPKTGVLHKINYTPPYTAKQVPEMFSKPRTPEMAQKSGLKAHEGIFKLAGLQISQKMVGGKVKREAVTFRVVSSKHQAEGRWMHPEVKAGRFLERTFEWVQETAWPEILRKISNNK